MKTLVLTSVLLGLFANVSMSVAEDYFRPFDATHFLYEFASVEQVDAIRLEEGFRLEVATNCVTNIVAASMNEEVPHARVFFRHGITRMDNSKSKFIRTYRSFSLLIRQVNLGSLFSEIERLELSGMVSDSRPSDVDYLKYYTGVFQTTLRGNLIDIQFYTFPTEAKRRLLQECCRSWVESLWKAFPEAQETTVVETPSDSHPASVVSLDALVARPQDYTNQRVSVVGFYTFGFEKSDLSPGPPNVAKHANGQDGVWVGGASCFANYSSINRVMNESTGVWVKVEGLFESHFYRDSFHGGHMGGWPGEINRVTKFEPVPSEK